MAEKKVKEIKAETKVAPRAGHFDILRRPIISEKSAKLSETNGLAFEVSADATKKSVAEAVKAIYNVAPRRVNILNAKGKVKTFRGKSTGAQKTIKKAYISLKAGDKIEIA